jgi:hypothetical protein
VPLLPEPGLLPGGDVFPEGDNFELTTARWRTVLTDHDGTAFGELTQATDRRLKFGINRIPTVTFTARVEDPLAPYLIRDDLTLVKAYLCLPGAAPALKFCGPITNHDKARSTGGGSIAVVAAGPAWRLGMRLIGKSDSGCTLTPFADHGQADLARTIIDAVNNGDTTGRWGAGIIWASPGDTGIRVGDVTFAGTAHPVGPWYYKPALQAITEMAGVLDGFEWRVNPTEPTVDGTGVQIGQAEFADAFGATRPDAVFEFGAGRANIAEYHELGDANTLCNDAINLPSGFPGSATQPVIWANNAPSIAARGRYESVITADITVDAFRQALVDEHVALRGAPRVTYTVTPVPDLGDGTVPRYGIDYDVGDVLPFRATETFPVLGVATDAITGYSQVRTIDALFRLYQAELALDDRGVATPTLTIIESE